MAKQFTREQVKIGGNNISLCRSSGKRQDKTIVEEVFMFLSLILCSFLSVFNSYSNLMRMFQSVNLCLVNKKYKI